MTWVELNDARCELGMTETQMAKLLCVGLSTYKGWVGHKSRKPGVPNYIAASVEAHMLLGARALRQLKSWRGI